MTDRTDLDPAGLDPAGLDRADVDPAARSDADAPARGTASAAAALDAADPLAAHTSAFVRDGDVIAYLDGNSLGRPLAALPERYGAFIERDWGQRLIRAWDEQWMERPFALGDRLGRLVGPRPGRRSSATRPPCCSTSSCAPPSTTRSRRTPSAPRS